MDKIDEIIDLMQKTYSGNNLVKDALNRISYYCMLHPSKKELTDFVEKLRPTKMGGEFIYLNKMISFFKQKIKSEENLYE